MRPQQGFTLVELMVGMFLSTIIATTVLNLYFYVKRNYLQAQELISTHYDLSLVKTMILRSVHQAGYTPCISLDQLDVYDQRSYQNKVLVPLSFINEPSGMLRINRMSEHFNEVKNIMTAYEIDLVEKRKFKPGYPLMIADCRHAEIITQYQQYKNKIILKHPLKFAYEGSISLGEYFEERWFIQGSRNKNPSLYYYRTHKEELTPVINSLKISQVSTLPAKTLIIDLFWGKGKTYSFRASVRA